MSEKSSEHLKSRWIFTQLQKIEGYLEENRKYYFIWYPSHEEFIFCLNEAAVDYGSKGETDHQVFEIEVTKLIKVVRLFDLKFMLE